MTDNELRKIITTALKTIAPETDPEVLKPDDSIRQKLGLDSFDFLQFIIAIAERLKVEIPEEDYSKVLTVEAIGKYLSIHLTDQP